MAKVTVIIPAYNCDTTIQACLASVQQQTETDLQILVVDDGSADHTQDICRKIASKDSRIEYIYQPNQGVSVARNAGLLRAETPYIMFIDSDDLVDERICEMLIGAIEAQPDFDLAICGMKRQFFCAGKLKHAGTVLPNCGNITSRAEYGANFGQLYEKTLLTSVWAKLYKSEVLVRHKIALVGGMHFAEDVFFNLDYQQYVRNIAIVNKPLYIYNHIAQKNSLSKNIPRNRCQIAETAFCKAVHLLKERGGPEADFSPVVNVFYKDCLNYLETFRGKKRWIRAKEVLGFPSLQMALKNDDSRRADMSLYRFCMKRKNPLGVFLLVSVRKLMKRILRGAT